MHSPNKTGLCMISCGLFVETISSRMKAEKKWACGFLLFSYSRALVRGIRSYYTKIQKKKNKSKLWQQGYFIYWYVGPSCYIPYMVFFFIKKKNINKYPVVIVLNIWTGRYFQNSVRWPVGEPAFLCYYAITLVGAIPQVSTLILSIQKCISIHPIKCFT